ncbi:MAG: protein kinase [Acidobacteriota bacterium]
MSLAPGTRIGIYSIVAPIGKGGMGEVYRAHDTKLGRDVALKVLPASFGHDPDRMTRFEREARVLASLNHPGIAHIYGVEEGAIAMELVPGPTLAERIAQGPIPVDEALVIARHIAEAVEYAHDHNVIHRDLKPANIKITPDDAVKVLDFGLAKALADESSFMSGTGDPGNSPTLTMGATVAGTILGTAAYMSPEQAKGKTADRRSDVWSFGVVLYEMLTGRRLFHGESTVEILGSVMKEAPALEHLPSDTPRAVREMLARCLQKDPKQRLQAIGEARILLSGPLPAAEPSGSASRKAWPIAAIAAVASVTAIALGVLHFREAPPADLPFLHYSVNLPGSDFYDRGIALSPDGRYVAVAGLGGLWVRGLDSLEWKNLAPQGATEPFWSPDSGRIAFTFENKLRRVPVAGGPSQVIADTTGSGGSWSRGGVIIFPSAGSILRVQDTGGPTSPVTQRAKDSPVHGYPVFLPDGNRFLYRVASPDGGAIYLAALDDPSGKLLLTNQQNGFFVPSISRPGSGYLVYLREGSLMAQRLDPATGQLSADATIIAEQAGSSYTTVRTGATGSTNGMLAYFKGGQTFETPSQLAWMDRTGKELSRVGPSARHVDLTLAPDGTRAVVGRTKGTGSDLWLLNLTTGVDQRLTSQAEAQNTRPVFSPDGKRIAFSSDRASGKGIYLAIATVQATISSC